MKSKTDEAEQLSLPFRPTLRQLLNSALAVDSIWFPDSLKPVRPTPRKMVLLRTTGKSKDQIVAEFAALLEKAGMLKRSDSL